MGESSTSSQIRNLVPGEGIPLGPRAELQRARRSIGNSVVGHCGEVLTVATEAAAGVVGLVIDGGARDVIALAARSGASCA